MARFERGQVRRILFEFEYPDGGRKTLDVETPSDVAMIAFDEHWVRQEDLEVFNVSRSDWQQNPATLMYRRKQEVVYRPMVYCTYIECGGGTTPPIVQGRASG